jgi:hypothetical protein
MKTAVFWALTPSSSERDRRFGRTHHLAACFCWFLAGSLFYPDDGDGILLRNVGLSPNYTALQPRNSHSSICAFCTGADTGRNLISVTQQADSSFHCKEHERYGRRNKEFNTRRSRRKVNETLSTDTMS